MHESMSARRLSATAAGVCLVFGGIVTFIARLAHGDLPAADAEAALRFITAHSFYSGVHLAAILGVAASAIGYVALADTFRNSAAWLFGRLGQATALIGAAVFSVDFAADGLAGQELATAWQSAAASARPGIAAEAATVFAALHGPSLVAIILFWGATPVCFGLALARDGEIAWLGWTGVAIGAATLLAASALFLQPTLFPGILVYGLFVLFALLWSVGAGVAVWLRARRADATPRVDATL